MPTRRDCLTYPVLKDGAATYTPGISERRGTATTYLHSGLKNTDAQSSTLGALTAIRQYDAFGNMASSTGTWQGPFGYAGGFGYQEDATGLRLRGHRLYDASTGRFLTRDPIEDGRNWYVYANSDPVRFVDPDGCIAWIPIFMVAILVIDIIDAAGDVKDIIEDPTDPGRYLAPVIGAIDPTPGNIEKKLFKRIRSNKIRSMWEEAENRSWPQDGFGRNYDVSHKIAIVDGGGGGDNSLDKIEPLPHDVQMKRHVDAGDFKRWGGIRYE